MGDQDGLDTLLDLELSELWTAIMAGEGAQEFLKLEGMPDFIGVVMRGAWAKGAAAAMDNPERVELLVQSMGYTFYTK